MTIRDGPALWPGHPDGQVVGSPKQVAEQLITVWEESGCDGYLCTSTHTPGTFTEFTDLVVPILQKHGVARREYTGSTLRDHIHQSTPE